MALDGSGNGLAHQVTHVGARCGTQRVVGPTEQQVGLVTGPRRRPDLEREARIPEREVTEGRDELGPGDERLGPDESWRLPSQDLVGGDEDVVIGGQGLEVPAPGCHVAVVLHSFGGAPQDVDLLSDTLSHEGTGLGRPIPGASQVDVVRGPNPCQARVLRSWLRSTRSASDIW